MSGTELAPFLDAGEELFASLERETLACLGNLEAMPAEEIARFVEKRRKILDAIHLFGMAFNHDLEQAERRGEKGALEGFRRRQTALLRRVIETDGLLLALAHHELTSFKAKLATISRGRRALRSYREEGRGSASTLERIA